jgi:transglutaminase-like putative cysteine protease
MLIRIGYELVYECTQPTPMILMLNVHASRAADLLVPDHIALAPATAIAAYHDSFGNWCSRIVAQPGLTRISTNAVIRDGGLPEAQAPWNATQRTVQSLPEDTLIFLLGSRYCETDLLSETAWRLFSGTPLGRARVQAICDYVHDHITFGYESANATKTAFQVWNDRRGVCRDFAHLAITFCRCLNIPARYCTGYLGDIGVPAVDAPMDFSACFEAYLDDRWYTFDPRNNAARIGRVLIARGRDAADVAISTSFGPNTLRSFRVWTDEIPS